MKFGVGPNGRAKMNLQITSPNVGRALDLFRNGDFERAFSLIFASIELNEDLVTAYQILSSSILSAKSDLIAKAFELALLRHKFPMDLRSSDDLKFEPLRLYSKGTPSYRSTMFCTYFDRNYLSKGICMIKSLLAHHPESNIVVLCMDEFTEAFLSTRMPMVQVLSISSLTLSDPQYLQSRSNRSLVEWYFTTTSCLMNYLMLYFKPDIESITYLDADLYFFSSLSSLENEARGFSAQIIEHRFPKILDQLRRNGRFNVGWIRIFNDVIGRKIVADYRKDCLEWCFDKADFTRYADQKYLDYWPWQYPGVCISSLKGANVAPWNLSNYDFKYSGSEALVDGEPILFYHFHGVKRLPNGKYMINKSMYPYPETSDFVRFCSDYVAQLVAIDRELQNDYGVTFESLR